MRALIVCTLIVLSMSIPHTALTQDKKEPAQPFRFNKDQQVQQIKPKKPLRIKVHRTAKGEYTWDITGDNIDEIVKADARLRKLLKTE